MATYQVGEPAPISSDRDGRNFRRVENDRFFAGGADVLYSPRLMGEAALHSSMTGRGSSSAPSGDVRVIDQQAMGSRPAESRNQRVGARSSRSEDPEQLRNEPGNSSHRGLGTRRDWRGGYQGRGGQRPDGFTALEHSSQVENSGRQEGGFQGEVDGHNGQENVAQSGANRHNSEPQSSQSTSGANFRVETPDRSETHQQDVHRDNGRRRGRGRSGGRARGGIDSGNWRRINPLSNSEHAGNPGRTPRVNLRGEAGQYKALSTDLNREVKQQQFQKASGEKVNVPQLVQELEVKLTKGKVECMICYDTVGRNSPIWSCASCFSIFHLPCIRKWARSPTSSDLSAPASRNAFEGNWRCPGCQAVQLISADELHYYCFCGQIEEPSLDYYITPHSCGGPCRKLLDRGKNGRCKHHCTMQCHPGPCPPCMALAPPRSCPCGKNMFILKCSEQDKGASTCLQPCGRALDCGRHFCDQLCHEGACKPCEVVVSAKCFCGRQQEGMLCGQLDPPGEMDWSMGVFSCELDCRRVLPCGQHHCLEKCHPGSCGECMLSPSVICTCPCGKKTVAELLGPGVSRRNCTDPVPTCLEACGKLLPCQKHFCQKLCHTGPCPPCEIPVEQKCRCGASARTVACHIAVHKGNDEDKLEDSDKVLFLCDRKCGKKKNCGRHRCSERCCSGANEEVQVEQSDGENSHLCTLPCGKRLRCKQHDCHALCHAGHCPPCLETTFTELSCACGQTAIPPPVPCGTPLPSCQYPCSVPQVCGHEVTHLCHFGDCPPCTVPVAKECVGNHVVLRGVPCGSRDIKCNKLCGKTRQCGLHACARTCHVGPCDVEAETFGQKQISCNQPCGAPRRDCPHTCSAICHPASACPEIPCKVTVSINCICGRLTAAVPCDSGGPGNYGLSESATMALSRLAVPLQPLEGRQRERVPLGRRKLACDEECAKLEKKRLLADAFSATAPGEVGLGLEGGIVGSEMLMEIARRDPQWVASIEDRFKYLLLGPKNGPGASLRLHVFCALAIERREAIHSMGERWGLTVTGFGREPRRFVVAHVTTKSKLPARSLFSKGPVLPLAGQALPLAGQARQPPFDPLIDMDPGLVVALLDLPRDADVSTLVLRFGGECELVWLNDRNALAIFSDAARAATALRRVDHSSVYRGAAGMPPPRGSSVLRGGLHATLTAGAKPPLLSKGMQDSNWVEDAWSDEQRSLKQEMGAWQRNAPPITTKNPWATLGQVNHQSEGSSSSSNLPLPASSSEAPSIKNRASSGVVGSKQAGISSSATILQLQTLDGSDDDWEKALEEGGL